MGFLNLNVPAGLLQDVGGHIDIIRKPFPKLDDEFRSIFKQKYEKKKEQKLHLQ